MAAPNRTSLGFVKGNIFENIHFSNLYSMLRMALLIADAQNPRYPSSSYIKHLTDSFIVSVRMLVGHLS